MSAHPSTDLSELQAATFLEEASFRELELAGVSLVDKELYRCTFTGVKAAESRWSSCIFESCTFEDCDFTRAALVGVSFRGVRFVRCKLLGVDFSQLAMNPDVGFEACDLRYTAFVDLNLRGLCFRDCELQEAQLEGCSLVNAELPGSDLTGATLSRCDLKGADLSSARGVFFRVPGNSVKDAFVSLETAVLLAQALGLKVEGYDKPPRRSRR